MNGINSVLMMPRLFSTANHYRSFAVLYPNETGLPKRHKMIIIPLTPTYLELSIDQVLALAFIRQVVYTSTAM